MRYCVWAVRGLHYAIPAGDIVEVAPLVSVRPLAHAPAWVRGLVDYHGELMPLIDAGVLLGHGRDAARMAARILILQLHDAAGQTTPRFGLLVECVIGLEALDFTAESGHSGLQVDDAEYLGPVAQDPAGMVQLVQLERLLTPEQRTVLFDRTRVES